MDKHLALSRVRWHGDEEREHRTELDKAVRRAHEAGATWEEIGEALGLTRQGAWYRFVEAPRTARSRAAMPGRQ